MVTCSDDFFVLAQLGCSLIPAALCEIIYGRGERHGDAKHFPARLNMMSLSGNVSRKEIS
jgi:hypothetical protein